MTPSSWQFIPNSILDTDKRQQNADSWATQQRSDLADRWAESQRALRQEHLDMIRAAKRKPTIEEWRAQQSDPDVNTSSDYVGPSLQPPQLGQSKQPPDIIPSQAPTIPPLPLPETEGGTVSSAVPPPALGQPSPEPVTPDQVLGIPGRAMEAYQSSIGRPISGLVTETANPTLLTGAKPVPGIQESGGVVPWWRGLGERQLAREQSGEAYIPAGDIPLMVGPGEVKAGVGALSMGLRGLPEEALAAGREYGAVAKSPALRQLAPGLGIEPVETAASYAAKLMDKYGSAWIINASPDDWDKYMKLTSQSEKDIASAGKLAPPTVAQSTSTIPESEKYRNTMVAKYGKGWDNKATDSEWQHYMNLIGGEINALPPSVKKTKSREVSGAWEKLLSEPTYVDESRILSNPNFRREFKDTQVLDKDGFPMLAYHATRSNKPFDVFRKTGDIGYHFGTHKAARMRAGEGSYVAPFYLNIKHPLVTKDLGGWMPQGWDNELKRLGIISHDLDLVDIYKSIQDSIENKLRQKGLRPFDRVGGQIRLDLHSSDSFRRYLINLIESRGYDGIKYINDHEDMGSTSWIAFHPEQIKSPYNKGTFNPASPVHVASHPAISGAIVGGLSAPQDPNATPQENLIRRLGGAAIGAGLGYGAGRLGMESRLGGTIKDVGGLDEVLMAIKSATTPEDIRAVLRGLGARPGKGIEAVRKAAIARSIELGQVADISKKELFKKAPKKPVIPKVPSPALTPEQQIVFSEAVKPSASKGIIGAVEDIVHSIQDPFTPAPGHPTESIINDLRTARGYLDLNKDQAVRNSHGLIKRWNREKPAEGLSFMQSIQQGAPQATAEKQALADNYRARFDADYQLAQQVKPDLPYRQDYFTKNGIWADERKAEEFYNNWRASLGGSPGALKKLQFPTIYDGIKAGLKIKETNPEILYLNNHAQLLRAKMASDFFEQQIAKGADPELVKRVLDRYLDPGLQHHDAFRSIMQANFALNSLELGLSGFHVLGTAINAIASKGALGLRQLLAGHPIKAFGSVLRAPTAPIEYIMRGNKAQAAAKNANLTADIQRIVEAGGRLQMPEEYKGTAFEQAMNDFKSGKYLQGAVGIPSAALNSISKPIMEWWVPRIKIGAAADAIENGIKLLGPNAAEEAKKSAAAKAWDSIDNRFGELVQDNMFWNKTIKDLSRLAMRSPGWNIGTFREFVGGAYDVPGTVKELLKTGHLNVTDRTAFAISLPITVGIISAVYQYLKTGEGPKEFIDYFYPKTGQTDPRTGKPERAVLPVYTKDIFSFVHDPFQTSINKISPIGSDLMSLLENRDYYGVRVRNPQADVGAQARQLLAHEAITHLPFSVTSGSRRISPTAEAGAEGFFGINKAPGFITGGYYATKTDLDKNLDPEQRKIADYVSLPSSKGGPSLRQKANLMLQPANDWTWQYLKQLNSTANPNDPLWSRSIDDIKAYIAYKSASFPQQRAKLVARYPWIIELNRQIGEEIDAGVRSSQQHSEEIKQTIPYRIQSALGVAPPEPTPRDPNALSTLTVRGLALTNAEADAYEKIKQGAEEQLVSKLNNSPIYQKLDQAQKQAILARYLPGADKAAEEKFLSTLDPSTLRQRLQQKAAGQ